MIKMKKNVKSEFNTDENEKNEENDKNEFNTDENEKK